MQYRKFGVGARFCRHHAEGIACGSAAVGSATRQKKTSLSPRFSVKLSHSQTHGVAMKNKIELSRRAVLGTAAAMVATPTLAEVCPIGPPKPEKGPLVWMELDQADPAAA